MAITIGAENIPFIGDKVVKIDADESFEVFDIYFESGKMISVHTGSDGIEAFQRYKNMKMLDSKDIIKQISNGELNILTVKKPEIVHNDDMKFVNYIEETP